MDTNNATATRQFHRSAKTGRSSPPRNVPIWTPDCLIPVSTPLDPAGMLSTIKRLVEGLPQPLGMPVAKAAAISTQ